jgi:hypothetical protein
LFPHPARLVAPKYALWAPEASSFGFGRPDAGANAVPYHFALHFRECGEQVQKKA